MNIATSIDGLAFIIPGPTEWLLIPAIVLVLFGAKKPPEFVRGLGQGLNEFRKARENFKGLSQRPEFVPMPYPVPANTTANASSTPGEAGCLEVDANGVKL